MQLLVLMCMHRFGVHLCCVGNGTNAEGDDEMGLFDRVELNAREQEMHGLVSLEEQVNKTPSSLFYP